MKAYQYLVKHKDVVVCKFFSAHTIEKILSLINGGELHMQVIREIDLGDKEFSDYTPEETGQKNQRE